MATGSAAGATQAASKPYHAETGKLRFIGSAPGRPIERPRDVDASAPPSTIARAFVERYGKGFGIRDQAEELRLVSSKPAATGRFAVRFQQVRRGVPVLGGELVVNLDPSGKMLSANGETSPGPSVSVTPRVERSVARQKAIAAVAKDRGVPAVKLAAGRPSLWIHDSRILGGPGLDRARLVWRVEVSAQGSQPIDELVLVDAQLGTIALHFDQIETAKDRWVCDANNTSAAYPCTAPVRIEGGPPSAIQDVNYAYDFAGHTYDFFFNNFGRDSLDGAGMRLKSTVRWCDPLEPCPYENAFWDGTQMVYGSGFAAADDVVGHELTHGVTEFSAHLFYYYQSGAINESLSDVFGEFVDLTNGVGTDTAATRWQMGEDLPGIGALRDMENPPAFGDPDRMTGPNYTADASEGDNGGVHTNSGVNNKAAFLMTDGATFNGRTVTGLGIPKAARIYYEAQVNLLTSASDYADLFNALQQACSNLVGTNGITVADCAEVTDAVLAVEMDQTPPAAPNPEAPVPSCPNGQSLSSLFFDDLENTASGNWALQTGSGANRWFYPQNPNSVGLDATYATSGTTNFWGYDQPATADFSIAMTSSVAIPAGSSSYLRFNHAHGFEDGSRAYDGGVLEYSVNGGASWSDAGSLLTHGGYNGTIANGFGNPFAGRSAFVRESNGYISSRADLSSLGGQSVRFRFRIGTDSIVDDYGWFVDDIRIDVCAPSHPRPNGAAKVRVTLVPAHQQCVVPNTDHGPPFPNSSNDACTPTGLVTDNLTVPNDDSTLHNASTTFRFRCSDGGPPPACGGPGDQAEVVIVSTVNDVRCAGTASGATPCGMANTTPGLDYGGKLLLRIPLRITDRFNGPSQTSSATLVGADFTAGLPCTATPGDSSQGSSCSLNTTTDALLPNFAREDQRALLALGQVSIADMGDNGTLAAGTIAGPGGGCPPACTGNGDEQAFLRQGIFVP